MIFDPSIPGLGYAPEDDPEIDEDDYPNEDEDMEHYFERKYE